MTDNPPTPTIVERLRQAHCHLDGSRLYNPDGAEAADLIDELTGALEACARQLDIIRPRDGHHRAWLCTKALKDASAALAKAQRP